MGRGAQQATVYGVAEVPDMTVNSHTHTHTHTYILGHYNCISYCGNIDL